MTKVKSPENVELEKNLNLIIRDAGIPFEFSQLTGVEAMTFRLLQFGCSTTELQETRES